MRWYRRAWLYVSRQRVRSAVLFLIFFFAYLAVFLGTVFADAAADAVCAMQDELIGYLHIAHTDAAPVTDDFVEALRRDADVSDVAAFDGTDMVFCDLTLVTYGRQANFAGHTAHLIGGAAMVHPYFLQGTFSMREGGAPQDGDAGRALISYDVARANNLALGDRITCYRQISPQSLDQRPFSYEICGIYDVMQNTETSNRPSWLIPANTIFVCVQDLEAIHQTYQENEDGAYRDGVIVFAENAQMLPQIAQRVTQKESAYSVTVHDEAYQATVVPLQRLNRMVRVLIVTVAILVTVIVFLILLSWIRGRTREIGICLSAGIASGDVMLQLVCESQMIALAAFVPASGAAWCLRRAVAEAVSRSAALAADMGIPNLSAGTVLCVGTGGLMLVTLAAGICAAWIVRRKPKALLGG